MMKQGNYENGIQLTCNGECESDEDPMMEHYVLEKLGIAQVGNEVVFRAGDRCGCSDSGWRSWLL